jgi:hypothetical protein
MLYTARIDMIAHIIVLLYVLYISFKHMMSQNNNPIKKMIAFCVFISALWLSFHRDTYLPFLGYTVIPPNFLKDTLTITNANVNSDLNIDEKDGTKIIFWGANPSQNVINTPLEAYGDFSNSGITTVENGKASIRFFCPAKYKVPTGITLQRHIHYRVIYKDGFIGPVQTTDISC